MNDYTELDKLIEKYSSELLGFGTRHGHTPSDYFQKTQAETSAKEHRTDITQDTHETESENNAEEKDEEDEDQTEDEDDTDYDEEENLYSPRRLPQEAEPSDRAEEIVPQISENPKANPENYATFTARIFAAEGAFPVEGAKVVVKRKGEIHSFLLTNGSGETKLIRLESYPEENSLEPLNPDQQMIYSADIYADGFESKKDLLVSAVGGSDIILQQFLVPEGGN